MATIVMGAGTSHSPMLGMGGAAWPIWGARDATTTDLVDDSGVVRTYDELVAAGPDLTTELTSEALLAKFDRGTAGLDELARRIAAADLDVMIVVGDDQDEHLGVENLPPILIYHGETILNTIGARADGLPPIMSSIVAMYAEPEVDRHYPVDSALADHMIAGLLDDGFDIASSVRLPRARAEGHAFQFPHRRLLPTDLPIVPVMLNTYLPPTQPRAGRCYQLGVSMARVVDAFPAERRVGVLASGGLSHLVVSEKLDRLVLDACGRGDGAALSSIPESVLQSGTSEIKNWIATAGACGHLTFDVIDYVAGYRTPAGTGVGLAFATWI
jgi:Catalytic LigB subunit of aromatic ring-opening dioxygenase